MIFTIIIGIRDIQPTTKAFEESVARYPLKKLIEK
jgi:hypothetical protein